MAHYTLLARRHLQSVPELPAHVEVEEQLRQIFEFQKSRWLKGIETEERIGRGFMVLDLAPTTTENAYHKLVAMQTMASRIQFI